MRKTFLCVFLLLSNLIIATNNVPNNQTVTVETVADLSTIRTLYGINATTAIVLGYHKKNDGGGGIFVYDSSVASTNDGGMIFNGWVRSLTDSAINVKWFGAISLESEHSTTNYEDLISDKNIAGINFVTDLEINNTNAFKNALKEFFKHYRGHLIGVDTSTDPYDYTNSAYGNKMGLSGIFIPSGEYLLGEKIMDINTDPNFIDNDENTLVITRTTGIKYFSDGHAVLTFNFKNSNMYAFKNVDSGLGLTFSNISFLGLSDQCNLFYSASDGGTQDYYFERCDFYGEFDKVFTLNGVTDQKKTTTLNGAFLSVILMVRSIQY